MVMTHTNTHKFKRQSVQKIEWKLADGQTDATDCFTFPEKAVGNNKLFVFFSLLFFTVFYSSIIFFSKLFMALRVC